MLKFTYSNKPIDNIIRDHTKQLPAVPINNENLRSLKNIFQKRSTIG